MEWISVKERLPEPFEIVWIFYRDREVVLGCHTYTNKERDLCDPWEGWYSFEDEKCRSTNWWKPASGLENIDKPLPPQE